jgi:hypothetical protein
MMHSQKRECIKCSVFGVMFSDEKNVTLKTENAREKAVSDFLQAHQ